MATATCLGEVLIAQGAIERATLNQALRHIRGRLGDFLHAHGLVDGLSLARALASQQRLETVDLYTHAPDAELFVPRDLPYYIARRYVPYDHRNGILTLATSEPSESLRRFAETRYHAAIAFVVTTERDLSYYFATRGAEASTRTACLSLRRRYRHLAADRLLLRHQWRGGLALIAFLAALLAFSPYATWQALLIAGNCFYLATLLVKFELYRHGVAAQHMLEGLETSIREHIASMEDADLPTYSILVPIYRERREVLAQLIAHLEKLDYPREKLDIKLICEGDDDETMATIKALRPPTIMQLLVVPPSFPRTKPKACNVALSQVRGEYTVIYDAEDIPAPDQLKRAVAMFRAGPPTLACVQASLNYYNRDENLLTRLFALEYGALFRLLLPGLERLRFPIPLSGTSNHIRTDSLRAVGGWDAFNVTEDADLGMRLRYFGLETHTLPSLTLEESPIMLGAWMKQRTRWIKGYIQTWLVFTRDARELKRRLGTQSYYGFQFFIGAPALTFLLAPFFWLSFLVSLFGYIPTLPPALLWLCGLSFALGMLSHWVFGYKVVRMEGWRQMAIAVCAYPFYWLLHSLAAARAVWQIITAPHYWDKTSHGISRVFSPQKRG